MTQIQVQLIFHEMYHLPIRHNLLAGKTNLGKVGILLTINE